MKADMDLPRALLKTSGRWSNTGGEEWIGKVSMLEALSEGCPHYQYSWSNVASVLQTTHWKQQVATYTWWTWGTHQACAVAKPGMVPSHLHATTVFWATEFRLLYIRTQMVKCCQSLQRFFLHHRPSLSWSDASAKPTAPGRKRCSCRRNNLPCTELCLCDRMCEQWRQ